MLREQLLNRGIGHEPDFRWRGEEVSRLEGFSDAVFGFVITLLVISTEVPKTFTDLTLAFNFSNVGSFVFCFLTLVLLWHSHYVFFRRYGLEDGPVFLLNAGFLCVVALYVYPLKFLFGWMLSGFPVADATTPLTEATPIRVDQASQLMVIYGLGVVLLYLTHIGLYAWAYHKRGALDLTSVESFDTLTTIGTDCVFVSIALVSILIAIVGGSDSVAWAGLIYALLPLLIFIFRGYRRRQHDAMRARANVNEQQPA